MGNVCRHGEGPFGNRRLQAERTAASRAQLRERRDHDLVCVRQIRRRCGREGSVRLQGQCHGRRVGCARGACQSADIPARRNRRRAARSGDFRRRRQHHQERGAVQNARQPVRQSARHLGPQAESHRRRRAHVLFRFLELRRIFALRKNLEVYGKSICPRCGGAIARRVHGQRARRSFSCAKCQGVRISGVPERRHDAHADPERVVCVAATRCTRPNSFNTLQSANLPIFQCIFRPAFAVRARRVSSASRSSAASRARGRPGAVRLSDTRDNS